MLQTSQDLFFIVAAIAVVWATVFLCWALYRLAIFLRTINSATLEVHRKIEAIDEWYEMTKQRVAHTFSFMASLTQGIETALNILKSRKSKKTGFKPKKVAESEESPQE